MGWIQKLNEVYDVAALANSSRDSGQTTLVPVGFTQKKVKFVVSLTKQGEFCSVRQLSDDECNCIVPSTPQAEARTGDRGTPFPLAEQLKYLVQDSKENPRLGDYLKQLKDWCNQSDAPNCLKALYVYLEKGTLLQDMETVLTIKFHKDNAQKDESGADAKELVCFEVQDIFSPETRLWERTDVIESWKKYFSRETDESTALCYVTGEQRKPMESHPKVRGNAKLISAKDAAFPFQYKGRFSEEKSAATVSEYASLRAHSALKYLMDKQGFSRYGMDIVAWNVQSGSIPAPIEEPDEEEETSVLPDTFEKYSKALASALGGYVVPLKNIEESFEKDKNKSEAQRVAEIVVLGLEAATKGRMSIFFYQELDGQTYAERLRQWYTDCCWQYYSAKSEKYYIRTPSPLEIARAVMGTDSVTRARMDLKCEKSDAKQLRTLYKHLLSCIVDSKPLPKTMVDSAVNRVEMPLTFKKKDSWERTYWQACLRTTCALIRKQRADYARSHPNDSIRIPQVAVDSSNTNRDYLYGRLFAVADQIEYRAADAESKKLPTNAIRMMRFFVQRPADGWKQLHLKLIPYLGKLGNDNLASYYQKIIGQIELLFSQNDRESNAPLKEDFLLGLYAQRQAKYEKPEYQASYTLSNNRSELFGCMLAVADYVEWYAESELGEKYRESSHDGRTHALRLMETFAGKPARTWEQLHESLLPYLEKLSIGACSYYLTRLHQIECCFNDDDRSDNSPLSSLFLHGYYCMHQVLQRKATLALPKNLVQTNDVSTREQAFAMLLALENQIERTVLNIECDDTENRVSNAMRYMRRYPHQPYTMWRYLEERMQPYARKLKRYRPKERLTERIENLTALLEENHWNTDAPLKSSWLHDYYANYYCKGE